MAELVTRRIIELDVKTSSEALRALKAQQESLRSLEKSVTSARESLKGFAQGMASAFTIGAVINGIKSVVDSMDALKDSAEQLGIGVENLQEWNHAAEMSGATAEDFAAGVRALTKNMQSLDSETDKGAIALRKWGVTANDSIDTALTKIAEGFSKLADGPQKTALAMELFSKSGTKLIPLLNEGAKGIERLKEEAQKLGIVLSEEAVEAAADLNDRLDLLGKMSRSIGQQLTTGLLPALNAIAQAFVDMGKSGDSWEDFGDTIGRGLLWLTEQGIKFVATIKAGAVVVAGLGQTLDALVENNGPKAVAAFRSMTTEVERLGAEANKTIADMNANYEKNRAAMKDKGKGAGGDPKPAGSGSGLDAPKIDKDVQALQRLIETMRQAAAGGRELNNVEKLDFELASGKLKVKTDLEKKLFAEARATAAMLDLRDRQLKQEKDDLALATKESEERERAAKEIDQIRESMLNAIDPTRALYQELALIEKVIEATADEATKQQLERYASTVEKRLGGALQSLKPKMVEFKTQFEDFGVSIGRHVQSWATDVTDALVDMAVTGKSSFKDMVNQILIDLARLTIQRQLQPMFDAFATWAAKAIAGAQGMVVGPSGVQAFASGGVVGGPTFFGMAGGGVGLMGEAGPEAVVPLKRTASGDLGVQASPVNVTVINNTPAQVKTEETTSPNGRRELQIMIDSAVEEGIGRGRFDRVMTTSYGVSRKGR